MDKVGVRQYIRSKKCLLSNRQRIDYSTKAGDFLYQYLRQLPVSRVALFLSLSDEIDTTYLLSQLYKDQRHTLLVPRVEGDIMRFYRYDPQRLSSLSAYGITEPDGSYSPNDEMIPEVIVVPGVAFDLSGGRVGRGRGYYDKYIALHYLEVKTLIAFCYHLQILSSVPMDAHDRSVDCLVTEQGIVTL